VTSVAETMMRYSRLGMLAGEWGRARAEYAHAVTSSAYSGAEVTAARERLSCAAEQLAALVAELDDHDLPAVAHGTTGRARQVGRLEGEIVLEAIAWHHARQDGSLYGREQQAEHCGRLDQAVDRLVDALTTIGAAT
jgi:hypothetical protein